MAAPEVRLGGRRASGIVNLANILRRNMRTHPKAGGVLRKARVNGRTRFVQQAEQLDEQRSNNEEPNVRRKSSGDRSETQGNNKVPARSHSERTRAGRRGRTSTLLRRCLASQGKSTSACLHKDAPQPFLCDCTRSLAWRQTRLSKRVGACKAVPPRPRDAPRQSSQH